MQLGKLLLEKLKISKKEALGLLNDLAEESGQSDISDIASELKSAMNPLRLDSIKAGKKGITIC